MTKYTLLAILLLLFQHNIVQSGQDVFNIDTMLRSQYEDAFRVMRKHRGRGHLKEVLHDLYLYAQKGGNARGVAIEQIVAIEKVLKLQQASEIKSLSHIDWLVGSRVSEIRKKFKPALDQVKELLKKLHVSTSEYKFAAIALSAGVALTAATAIGLWFVGPEGRARLLQGKQSFGKAEEPANPIKNPKTPPPAGNFSSALHESPEALLPAVSTPTQAPAQATLLPLLDGSIKDIQKDMYAKINVLKAWQASNTIDWLKLHAAEFFELENKYLRRLFGLLASTDGSDRVKASQNTLRNTCENLLCLNTEILYSKIGYTPDKTLMISAHETLSKMLENTSDFNEEFKNFMHLKSEIDAGFLSKARYFIRASEKLPPGTPKRKN